MIRKDYWRLSINYWPSGKRTGDDHGHEFHFANPPSREDFLALFSELLWMSAYEKNLRPAIESNPWPMIDYAHKAASADLVVDTIVVGRLTVCKQTVWENDAYNAPFITCELIKKVTQRLKGDREAAAKYLDGRGNEIRERCSKLPAGCEDAVVRSVMRNILREGGYLK